MRSTILRFLAIVLTLGATLVGAAASGPEYRAAPPGSGSSAAVPPGKVMLPPLPFAKMPDTGMPQTPPLAPLPAPAGPARRR
jgi:hypothetical protein